MSGSTNDPTLRGRRIGLSYESAANLFCRDLVDGVREAAAARGVEVIARDSAQSPRRQLADISALLDEGVDVLVISALDPPSLTGALAAAEARGIPVFTVDRGADGPVVSHVTSDNQMGGRLAAGLLLEALGGEGEVAIVGLPSASSVEERLRGFKDALSGQSAVRLVAEVSGESNRQQARAVAAALLRDHPNLAGIFAINDVTVQGVLGAIHEAGRSASAVVVGYDATPQGCEEIMRGGPLRGEVAQFPQRIGHTVVDLWADYLRGVAVPGRVEIPVELVTRENVERFTGAERLLRVQRGEVRIAGERVVFFPVRG